MLELDQNVLKTELEIHAFGKRTRIVKEIAELKRPASTISSLQPSSPNGYSHHTRTTSQTTSLPGSAHHSLRSPALGTVLNPESPPHTGDLAGTPAFNNLRRDSDPGSSRLVSETDQEFESSTVNNSTLNGSAIGLGIGMAVGSSEQLEPPKMVGYFIF